MIANSPFGERRRSRVRRACAARSGCTWTRRARASSRALWKERRLGYVDYVEWALDAGMFLFKRGERVFANTGPDVPRLSRRTASRANARRIGDWRLHLNTLFPEARLKNTIEVRGCDAQRLELSHGVPALFTGILYDERALAEAEELARELRLRNASRRRAPRSCGTRCARTSAGTSARALAERVLDIALGGLDRRARLDANGRTSAPTSSRSPRSSNAANVRPTIPPGAIETNASIDVAELVRRTDLVAIANSSIEFAKHLRQPARERSSRPVLLDRSAGEAPAPRRRRARRDAPARRAASWFARR